MLSGYRVFGAETCSECPLALEVVASTLLSVVPAGCIFFSQGWLAAVVISSAAIVLPRFLWRPDAVSEGPLFHAALAIYWNAVYVIVFSCPFLLAWCCWISPWLVLPPLIAYAGYAAVTKPEVRDGRGWPWFACYEWGYHAFRRFVRLKVHVSEELWAVPADTPVILAIHPHGVTSDYRILMDGILYSAFPKRNVLTLAASIIFRLPLLRELCLWTRCIDASRPVAERALKRGNSLMVLPGGEREQIRTSYGKDEVFLPSAGFVKLALKSGVGLVPCYVFGCVDLYKTYSFMYGFREWLRKQFRVCVPIYSGSVGVLPRRVPLNVVCGKPMNFQCGVPGQPTDAEVRLACEEYIAALQSLFEEHKAAFGYQHRQLRVESPRI